MCIHSRTARPTLNTSAGEFLARKLREAYTAQRRTTRYMASLTVLAGAASVMEWLGRTVDDRAPTPLTFRDKIANSERSVYVLHRSEGERCGRGVGMMLTSATVPSADRALENLLAGSKTAGSKHTKTAVARLRNAAAIFIRTGLELYQQQ